MILKQQTFTFYNTHNKPIYITKPSYIFTHYLIYYSNKIKYNYPLFLWYTQHLNSIRDNQTFISQTLTNRKYTLIDSNQQLNHIYLSFKIKEHNTFNWKYTKHTHMINTPLTLWNAYNKLWIDVNEKTD